MTIRFDGQVAIVTGAGQGLGRRYALDLAARGAKVVVNDLGAPRDGRGSETAATEAVVNDIKSSGGEAFADGADVTDPGQVDAMVERAVSMWGRVDILINNAGILRDKTFAKMDVADFKAVFDVHVMGTVQCTKAVWPLMREQSYGRIVMTTSSSGLYGNFGQSNYSAAKMALIGLMNTLHLEGKKYDIRVNAVSPCAATRMTEDLMPREALAVLKPEYVSAGVLYLASSNAPSREILAAGAGTFARALVLETEGVTLPPEQQTPEEVAKRWHKIADQSGATRLTAANDQTIKFVTRAMSETSKS